MNNKRWTKGETVLAFALYCKIPFNKINKTNHQIIKLADFIGRTPSSVSMKMCNFGRFDPELSKRGISGLKNGSKLDKEVWDEFYQNMEKLYAESEKVLGDLSSILYDNEIDLPVGENIAIQSTTRKGQAFFRKTVLSAYNTTCCITGINISRLLEASHIKSWGTSDPRTERTNPQNGLCLNVLHHKAFDTGLITIDTDYKILLSKKLKSALSSEIYNDYFLKYEGKKIALPSRFIPLKEFIICHNSQLKDF